MKNAFLLFSAFLDACIATGPEEEGVQEYREEEEGVQEYREEEEGVYGEGKEEAVVQGEGEGEEGDQRKEGKKGN